MNINKKLIQKKSNILIEGYPSYISNLLGNRGIFNKEDADFFVYANWDDLRDPFSAKGMREAIELTRKEIEKGTKIKIFGDYDCDGVTSSSVAITGLRNCNANVSVRLPCRITEGYGISMKAVKELIEENVGLIITVDNGIKSLEEIKYAMDNGIKVIVLDHHIIGDKMPEANVVVDLHREDETFGYSDLAGVGVAFLFVRALYKEFGIDDEKAKELLDLVAIGTVADCVPLTGENRILVKEGLKVINSKNYNRKGILTIIRKNFMVGHVTSTDIGFKIAPVINAPGRLLEKGADRAFRMVMDIDGLGSEEAEFLMRINQERKELTIEGVSIADEYIENNISKDDKMIVIYLPNQPEGIIGLISGRVTEKYWKPSIVFTDDAHGGIKASGRSIKKVDLYECLTSCGALFDKYGGHEQAAGMSMKIENLEKLREGINIFINDNYTEDDFVREDFYEIEVEESELTNDFFEKLDMIEPCGVGNEKPIVKVKNFELVKRKLKNGSFDKYAFLGEDKSTVVLYGNDLEAFCFGMAKEFIEKGEPSVVNLYGTLGREYSYGVETHSILVNKFEEISSTFVKITTDNNLLSQIANLAANL